MEATDRVRAIEWETVPRDLAGGMGLTPIQVKTYFGDEADLAVVKCVCLDRGSEKITCIANEEDFKELLANGQARDPGGMQLGRREFPLVLPGWRDAS